MMTNKCQLLRQDVVANLQNQKTYIIGDFDHLEELYMCENQLNVLPNSICKLKNLRVLKETTFCMIYHHHLQISKP